MARSRFFLRLYAVCCGKRLKKNKKEKKGKIKIRCERRPEKKTQESIRQACMVMVVCVGGVEVRKKRKKFGAPFGRAFSLTLKS